MDVEVRAVEPGELETLVRVLAAAFSESVSPEAVARDLAVMEPDRARAAFEGSEMVGGASAARFRITVPGGRPVPVVGVTGVGVLPSHRRRGINSALMRAQLDDIHERGEPLAVLLASEGGIYGRYGYGLASFMGQVDVDADRTTYVRGYRPSGQVRIVDRDDAMGPMRAVYDAAVRDLPGMVALDDRWWTWIWTEGDAPEDGSRFYALHQSEEGVTDAYAVYRVKHEWPDDAPRLNLSVIELLATSPQAYADMWRFVFDIDLVRRVRSWNRPVDDPLLRLVAEPRRLRFRLRDALWLRLVDLPAALSARGYRGDGRLTMQVRDDFCPWNEGRFTLEVADGEGLCTPAPDAGDPDLRCSVNELGAVYLGGAGFEDLHRANRLIEVVPGAIARADAMFESARAPWCAFTF